MCVLLLCVLQLAHCLQQKSNNSCKKTQGAVYVEVRSAPAGTHYIWCWTRVQDTRGSVFEESVVLAHFVTCNARVCKFLPTQHVIACELGLDKKK